MEREYPSEADRKANYDRITGSGPAANMALGSTGGTGIMSEYGDLRKELGEAEQRVEDLESKLAPLLADVPTSTRAEELSRPEASCEIGMHIRNESDRLRILNSRLSILCQRIDL